jgi:hypothetical protein
VLRRFLVDAGSLARHRAAMSRAETEAHRRLKQLAAVWALAAGFDTLADEVGLPRSPYRVDLVAAKTRGPAPEVALFECKQARADLLKDAAAEAATSARLAELHERRVALEELLAVHRPDLRVGETLFPEFDRCDFTDLRHEGYHALVAEIGRLKARLYGRTKFAKLVRWGVAHACYLVVEPGICTAAEVPEGWGLLVREGDALTVARRPVRLECREPWMVVAALARAGSRRLLAEWHLRDVSTGTAKTDVCG